MHAPTFLAAALVAGPLLLALGGGARADLFTDCQQEPDSQRRIAFCTQLIEGGEWDEAALGSSYASRGDGYYEIGDYTHAVKDFSRALALNPEGWIYRTRGSAYARLRLYERAWPDFEEALRLDPDDAGALNLRGWYRYLTGGDFEAALADADRSLELDPRSHNTIDTRAHVLAALGRPEEALAAFEDAMDEGGPPQLKIYYEALVAHGYDMAALSPRFYTVGMHDALLACLEAGCRLVE